nr:hypothetical protein [Tanacetum cinerariifolium]
MEDQPLPTDASPTSLSLGYVVDSDPEKDEKDPKRILLTILSIKEIKMMMSHLMMTTMMMMLRRMTSNEELKEPMEDQPLPADASPTALSPGYVVNVDPEKDEKDPKEDSTDYPADRGDNDDDESSNDNDGDDDVEKDEEDKEEEEHLALADPFDVSTDDLVPSS